MFTRRREHHHANTKVGDDPGEHVTQLVASRDVVDVDGGMIEHDLGDRIA